MNVEDNHMSTKIIDVFLFCNELDMLELRLTEHEEVDLFVIVEARKTFTNKDKPLNYEENKNRYKKWHEKIIYLIIDSYDDSLKTAWDREHYTRNFGLDNIKDELIENGILETDTLILSSDLDEIVDNDILKLCKKIKFNDGKILSMDFYYYNCNWKIATQWALAKIINYQSLDLIYQGKLQNLRSNNKLPIIQKAGWHLSYFLTVEQINYKLNSFSHTEYSGEKYNNFDNIKNSIESGRDLFGRADNILVRSTEKDKLPKNILILPEIFHRKLINYEMNNINYIYTNNWFGAQKPIHEKYLNNIDHINFPIKILEIGSHEGRSSVFFTQFLINKNSSLTCIDPFLVEDTTTPVDSKTYEIYKHNIKLTGRESQIYLEKDYSFNALIKLYAEQKNFDYILIDGSHLSKDVIEDAILSFRILRSGGIMFFDDYLGGDVNSLGFPKIGIDSFVNSFKDKIEILHVGYHYVIKKL